MTREQILEALKEVQDPELKRDIISLGMVKDVQTSGGEVFIKLEVASENQSFMGALKKQVVEKLHTLDGVESVKVTFEVLRKAAPAMGQSAPVTGIRNVIAVASGKGGVGKSTVAVNLACALAKQGHKVGLMDGDIYGPNIPLMLGVDPHTRPQVTQAGQMVPLDLFGVSMISMGVLVPPDQPMIWRGPMLHGAITQFIQKVDWKDLDYLIVDLPPGTGDVQLSLVQVVPLTGAVIVTTPQEVALLDVRKGVAMFRKTNVPILGVIENMAGPVFGEGGGEKAAKEFQVPFLGRIPLDAKVRECGDSGKPVVVNDENSPAAQSMMKAAGLLKENLQHIKTG